MTHAIVKCKTYVYNATRDSAHTDPRPRSGPETGPLKAGKLTVCNATSDTLDQPTDPDLAAVIAAWARLPEPITAGIVAMVRSAGQG